MLKPTIPSVISFLLAMLVVYLWASQRNLAKTRPSTHQEYLWRLKQITGKSGIRKFSKSQPRKKVGRTTGWKYTLGAI